MNNASGFSKSERKDRHFIECTQSVLNTRISNTLSYLSEVKIRSIHNAIRLRVRKSEIALLKEHGVISETIHFPGGTSLLHVLKKSDTAVRVTAEFVQSKITISLPNDMADEWIDTDEVGIQATIELEETAPLEILIEKDFPCLDRANEDKSDTFWELAAEKKPDNC